MTSFASRQRDLTVAGSRLRAALQRDRRLARLRSRYPTEQCLPEAAERLRSIEVRTARYLTALSRYREALEGALGHNLEPIGPRVAVGDKHLTPLHTLRCRLRPRPSPSPLPQGKEGRRRHSLDHLRPMDTGLPPAPQLPPG